MRGPAVFGGEGDDGEGLVDEGAGAVFHLACGQPSAWMWEISLSLSAPSRAMG